MVPTILIAGTWGDAAAWWRQGSPFWKTAVSHGVSLLNGQDAYNWTTEVDGLFGRNRDWETAGDALRWYAAAKGYKTVNVIAHSHGGQPAFHAAAELPSFHDCLTCLRRAIASQAGVYKRLRLDVLQLVEQFKQLLQLLFAKLFLNLLVIAFHPGAHLDEALLPLLGEVHEHAALVFAGLAAAHEAVAFQACQDAGHARLEDAGQVCQ